jgi:radical SAM protein with 4Fe4S-binding SPASM domain
MSSASHYFDELRTILARQALVRSAYQGLRRADRALRSGYWRLSDPWRFRGAARDPNDPWRAYPFVGAARGADKLRIGDKYRPITVQCETVNTCNNLCIICAYPSQDRKKAIMPMPIFEKVLRDYSEMGGGYLSMTPVTGDILMDRYLLERLQCVKRYPAIREIGVTTNAAMLDRFSDAEVRGIVGSYGRLQISIYGLDEEEYFEMTKRKTFDRALDGIRRILAVRTQNVFLAFRLLKRRSHRDVQDWIRNVVGCAEPVRISSLMFGGYANFTSLDTTKKLPFDANWGPTAARKTQQCIIPLLALQVSSNGDVAICPCVGALDDLLIGNIRQNTLLELFNSPKTRALWDCQNAGVPESCARCSFYAPLDAVRSNPSLIENPFDMIGA